MCFLQLQISWVADCYIEGSVDFIFGNNTALLEHCHIHCKSAGFITAQSRKSSQETTGYVFLRFVLNHLSVIDICLIFECICMHKRYEIMGFCLYRCVITGNGGTQYSYLGRPWGPFGRVVFAYTYMDACVYT
ncbi:putative pectinesterase [Helianthus debilis subsp. tardiflorus]